MFLANWPKPDKKIGSDYSFFAHFKTPPRLRFLGTFKLPLITWLEKHVLKFYVLQPLVAFFLSFKFDLVLAYSTQSGLPLAFLFRLLGRKHPPLLVFDVETFGRPKKGARLALTRYAAEAIDHTVYASSGQLGFYEKTLPSIAKRSTHIPIGIGDYEKQLDFQDAADSDFIVAIGKHDSRFRDWKTLLAAFLPFSDRINLTIVGRETIEPEHRGGVRIAPNVTFVPYVPIEKLARQVEGARFAILPLPERNQSLGQLSILYLMAMGKAVIAGRVIGIADYLEQGVTGLFYEPGDPASLTACIEQMLDDPDGVVRMGRAARQAVVEKFSAQNMGQRWEQCIDDLLEKKK